MAKFLMRWFLRLRCCLAVFYFRENLIRRISQYKIVYKQQLLMASLVDEETTSDIQDIQKKVIQQLKTYTFFIFYQKQQLPEGESISLQKLAFKLKQQKNNYHEKYGDNGKNIQLHFCDVENEYEVDNSLIDLKTSCQQNKTKIVFFAEESALLSIILKARLYHINIPNIPLCIYTNGLQSDLSKFLGWGPSNIKLASFSVNQIQPNVRKWVESPTQKIDMWAVQIKVDEDNGLIHKVGEGKIIQNLSKSKTHHQYFLSSFSLGYHPQLMMDFDLKKTKDNSFFNKIKYSFEGLRKFCCVGSPSMRSSTGIVKMDFVDDKGSHEMLKQFREYEGDEEGDMMQSKKVQNRRKVLSIVGSNIDRFNGQKLGDVNSRMNDNKLQLMTFSSLNECKKVSSIAGELTIKLSTQSIVYLQVNDSCYRLEKPQTLTIKQHSKVKVFINKQTLQC